MEIKINSKVIDAKPSIITIQYDNEKTINKLIKDYNPIIIDNTNLFFLGETVLDEISLYNKYPELEVVNEVIRFLELNSSFLDKKITELSVTEKIYLNLLRNVSKTEDIILFKNIFLGLDLNNQKRFINIINYLKERFIVLVLSDNVNVLYQLGDFSVLSSKRTVRYDTTDKIYSKVKELIKLNLEIPTLPYITYKAKEEKNVKLFYSKDVRDIIKDIYKHV